MIQFLQKEPTLFGIVFLLITLSIQAAIPYGFFLLGISGLFLGARWQFRGFSYWLVLFGLTLAIQHTFFIKDHLWQLGLQGALISSLFLTVLGFEQETVFKKSLQSQIDAKNASLQNFEEELAKGRQTQQEQKMAFEEKTNALQKELEELQTEHSSILILNEVLRKRAAHHGAEQEKQALAIRELETSLELLRGDYEASEKELKRLKETDPLVLQNGDLMRELNQARIDREQTHLINETLARLHLREALKAKEADQEAASLKEQLRAAHEPLKKVHLSDVEPLFKQLKKQFEEKNQVLHEVRAALFKTETELQKLQLEKAALELNPIPKEIEGELEILSSQMLSLEEENRELHELITVLSDASRVKKKVKTQPNFPEQELLF